MSEIGDMVDFLKSNPYVSMEDYKWKMSVPLIRLMSFDNTHINYLSEKQRKMRKAKKIDGKNVNELNDLGVPIFKDSNN